MFLAKGKALLFIVIPLFFQKILRFYFENTLLAIYRCCRDRLPIPRIVKVAVDNSPMYVQDYKHITDTTVADADTAETRSKDARAACAQFLKDLQARVDELRGFTREPLHF